MSGYAGGGFQRAERISISESDLNLSLKLRKNEETSLFCKWPLAAAHYH